ncbi:MAG TPA: hypothetical protein VFW40_07630, partial [Capsulimonadaceae bacterium]|nr:hypothetical protein [Capsulimonadaceae bacterium]
MGRVIVIVMDGCGVGSMPDAAAYGSDDPASNTLAHVAEAVGGLHLPMLQSLGLGNLTPISGILPLSLRERGQEGEGSVPPDSPLLGDGGPPLGAGQGVRFGKMAER